MQAVPSYDFSAFPSPRLRSRLRRALSVAALPLVLGVAGVLGGCGGGGGGAGDGAAARADVQILAAPLSQSVDEGASAVLSVLAVADGPLAYQWQRDGRAIDGANAPVYVTPVLSSQDDSARYAVEVRRGERAVLTPEARVSVKPVAPKIVTAPASVTVDLGQSPRFEVQAGGSGPLSYRWQRDGADIPGADGPVLTAPPAVAADHGSRWRVVVRNPVGETASADALLQIRGQGPVITAVMQFALAATGQRLAIDNVVQGTGPFRYQWFRNGEPIAGAGGTTNDGRLRLETPPLQSADDGVRYHVSVETGEGRSQSSPALIAVSGDPLAAAGAAHTLVRSRDGQSLWAWGRNDHGQLGVGDRSTATTPRRVDTSGAGALAAVAAGSAHSLALGRDGRVWAWGRNDTGALGDGTLVDKAQPQRVPGLTEVVAIAAAAGRSFAVRRDGSVWAWGENATGALGLGSQNPVSTPSRVGSSDPQFADIVAVAAGARHTLALRSDGRVFAMGELPDPASGVAVTRAAPVLVPGLAEVSAIAAGEGFSLAADIQGRLMAWGWNADGQLGVGDTAVRAQPTRVERASDGERLQPLVRLAAGNGFGLASSLLDSVLGWGANGTGQLGLGSTAPARAPTPVPSLGGMGWLAGGGGHAVGVRRDGSVFGWGDNRAGQLGLGSAELQRERAVQVPMLQL